ncbi:hypothetical protein ABDK00_017965 [Niabella insulamsoli]|uniref:hypothetical protein n=1 Tax=Niabella insulamsoli TaxID=3144874 RepID=UPI0031FBE4F2
MKINDLYITQAVCIKEGKLVHNNLEIALNRPENKDFFQVLYDELEIDYPRFFKMDAMGKLGIAAGHLLLKDFAINIYQTEELGIVLSNRSGSIEADVNYFESAKTFPSPSLFVYTLPNIVIGEISIRYGFKGENAFFISEQFNAEWMVFYVNDLMENRGIRACICGWIDVQDGQYDVRLFLIEKGKNNGLNFTAGQLDRMGATA